MKTRLSFLLLTAILIVAGVLPALYSDGFMIGAFSNIKSNSDPYDADTNTLAESIATKAQEAGFNALICKSIYETSENSETSEFNPSNTFSILNSKNLDAIHEDWIFYPHSDPSEEKYGYTALSSGIDMKFEAEYASNLFVNNDDHKDDAFFYMSAAASRVGNFTWDADFSNDNYWGILDGTSGYAYQDISYRWPNGDNYDRVGKEFMFLGETTNGVQIVNNNTLNIKFVFRVDDLNTYAYSDTLAVFSFVTYSDMTTEHSIPSTLFFYHPSSSNAIDSFVLTKSVYDTLTVFDHLTGRKELEFQFPLRDNLGSLRHTLDNQGLLTPSGHNMQLSKSLNPWMYWCGRGNLKLDYVEYYDDIFANYTNNPDRLCKLRSYETVVNLRHFQGMDEPKAPNFESFKKLKEYLQTTFPVDERYLVAAINLDHSYLTKFGGDPYRLPHSYLKAVSPRKMMIDVYPFTGEYIRWNDQHDGNFVQNFLTKVCEEYEHFRSDENISAELIFIPQTFGDYSHAENEWKYLLPPAKTARCLQLLPLCYKPDGVVSFKFDSTIPNPPSARVHYALAWRDKGTTDISLTPQYYEVQEANRKLRCYAPIVRSLKWKGSQTIKTNVTAAPDSMPYIDNLRVLYDENAAYYQGYIQTGFYTNNIDSDYLMCINRRADIALQDLGNGGILNGVAPQYYNSITTSIPHQPQTLCIAPRTAAHTTYGTHLAFYDAYDDSIFHSESGEIKVEIDPGDGRLLEMCSTLPTLVTSDADVKNIAYLSGSITIDQGAEVTIHPETETKIFAHSTIMVTGGSTLNISGTVDIADSVSIIVENGSNVIFDNAMCNWGVNSYLQVVDSGITVTNTILESSTDGNTWRGLRITNAGTITMTSSTISGAQDNVITNSQVLITDCRFNIPDYWFGLTISNSLPSHNVRITATADNKGFYSTGANSFGLMYGSYNGSLFLSGMTFDGLSVGFLGGTSSAVGDTIQYCDFYNNNTGMLITGLQTSPLILNCIFIQNDRGAHFEAASPKVMDCGFISCDVGIRTELSTSATGGIYNSIFELGETGIVSRGSNQRVADNKFSTNTGILNHAGSLLNMGNSANNLFEAQRRNLKFQDTASYTARVQLYQGHNDFYQKNPGLLNPSIDFHFDSNWYVGSSLERNTINANYNWFEDDIMKVVCPGTPSHYVSCYYYDPEPNISLEVNERMAQALSAELAGNYQSANNTYKTILDENEISESELLFDALDAYYRTADLAGDTLSGTESYLLSKISQYDADNPILTKYLQDYLIKNRLQAEAFQTAIDLLELRILNAESPVDSLHAVMDLEIVLHLAAMSETKKPINTKFTQYKYPDRNIFIAKHEEHWELLDELLNVTEDEPIPIPDKPLISSNYPNPFNPSTTIIYSIPKTAPVSISVYNIKGQKVKNLLNAELTRGQHKLIWDGKDAKNRYVSSGIYFFKLESGGKSSVHKAMLLK